MTYELAFRINSRNELSSYTEVDVISIKDDGRKYLVSNAERERRLYVLIKPVIFI